LRTKPFTALRSFQNSGPCLDLSRDYFSGCLAIARVTGDEAAFANRILDVLPNFRWKPTDVNAKGNINIESYSEELSGELIFMVPRLRGQESAFATRNVDLMGKLGADDILATENLTRALEELAPRLEDADKEKLASEIVKQLSNAEYRYALDLVQTIDVLGERLHGNQLELAVNRITDLIVAGHISLQRLKLARSLRPEQAERVDRRIVGLIERATSGEAPSLGSAANLSRAHALIAAEGQLAESRVEEGAAKTVALLRAALQRNQQTGQEVKQQVGPSGPGEAQNTAVLIQAVNVWVIALNGRPAENIANQLVALVPLAPAFQAPALTSALAVLTPKLTGNQAELGSNIVALLTRAQGATAENLALALMELAARAQVRSDQKAVGFQRVLQLMKTDPNLVATVAGMAAAYLDASQAQQLADQITELLKNTNVDNVGRLGDALLKLGDADPRNFQHLEFASNRIMALLGDGKGGQAKYLGGLLAQMGSRLPPQEVENFATQIASDLSKAATSDHPRLDENQVPFKDNWGIHYPALVNLASALSELAAGSSLKGGQANLAVNKILGLLENAVRDQTGAAQRALGGERPKAAASYADWNKQSVPALAYHLGDLAKHLTAQEQSALANRILDLVSQEVTLTGHIKPMVETSLLMSILVDLTPRLAGDQSAMANRTESLLRSKPTAELTDQLNDSLLGLAANADATARKRILLALLGQPRQIRCDVAIAKAKSSELPLLVDMLKWPICIGPPRGIILQIAAIKQEDATKFGSFENSGDRHTFTPDLPSFLAWLLKQNDDAGRRLDVDGPPMLTPLSAGAIPVASPKDVSGRSASQQQ
jgi:hypothetical protein